MIFPVVQLGDPVLRTPARDVPRKDIGTTRLNKTIASMRDTMHAAVGVGLAAPQVGLDLRIAVIQDHAANVRDDPEANLTERRPLPFMVIINPSYEAVGDETRTFFEGCLSMNGWRALVERHHRVIARWTDEKGREQKEEFSGWPARILQHEIDHLNGIVYVDHCLTRTLMTTDSLDDRWADKSIAEVRRALGA